MNDKNENQVLDKPSAGGATLEHPSQSTTGHQPPSPPPPRGPSWKSIVTILVSAALLIWIGSAYGPALKSGAGRVTGAFSGGHDHAAEAQAGSKYYTCSMHPWVILPKPGLCPVCHMDLVPLDPAKFTGKVEVDPLVVQNIGVRVTPVTAGPLTQTIRTVGTVDFNETAVRDVNIKLAGWIEKLHVDYLGSSVTRGQPLLDLYAPDLYAAQQEYLLAYKDRARTASQPTTQGRDLLSAARTRLAYYDISDDQIAALEQRGEATKTMTIFSPHSGAVIAKTAYEGMRVEPGTQLFRIADLSSVWVMVTLYEYQLPYVQAGQQAVMSLPYIPGQTFEGKVIYIYPTLDEKTRQVRVRLEFANSQGLLKPGMFAEVQLKSTLAEDRVLAPREAIIDTGERQVAFVSLGDGKFEPRQVQAGVQTENGMVQVLGGLKPGEMVVTSGQFLLDSESRIRESLAKMVAGTPASTQKTAGAAAEGPSESTVLPAAVTESLARTIQAYLKIGDQLARDTTDRVASEARIIAENVTRMAGVPVPGDEHFWHKHEEAAHIRGEALHLVDEQDLTKARTAYADLSVALGKFLQAVGVPAAFGKPLEQLHCPMYREGQGGGIWMQTADSDVRNPYFGKSMLKCFDKRQGLPMASDHQPAAGAPTAPAPSGHATTKPAESQPAFTAKADLPKHTQLVNEVVRAYLAAQEALTKDDLEAARKPMPTVMRSGNALHEHKPALAPLLSDIGTQSARANDSRTLEDFRQAFGRLSPAVIQLAKVIPPTPGAVPSLYAAYCPMVKQHWLQAGREIRNPYDPTMLECGTLKSEDLVKPVQEK